MVIKFLNIVIKAEDAEELHEILCEIPYEKSTMLDSEPPMERYSAVESIITQLEAYIKLQYQEEEE